MIGHLTGNVSYLYKDVVVLDVCGVGYQVHMDKTDLTFAMHSQKPISVFITAIQREDGTTLYGFLSITKKMWFDELIKINGVSGKLAMLIFSNISENELRISISTENPSALQSISGIGPKIASRIVLESKNSIKKISEQSASFQPKNKNLNKNVQSQSIPDPNQSIVMDKEDSSSTINESHSVYGKIKGVEDALLAFGFNPSIAQKISSQETISNPDLDEPEIVKICLKKLDPTQTKK